MTKSNDSDYSKLQKQLVAGRISRRDFIAGTMALGLPLGAATSLMSETVRAATPKRGGRLKMAYSQGTVNETFEQTKMTTVIDANRSWGCYNGLARVTRSLEAEPMLAESWETKPGAKEWTFKLREGVEFHNGKTLDAQDVIASLSRHLGPDSQSPAKPLLEDIVDMKADGKYRVNVTLKGGKRASADDVCRRLPQHHPSGRPRRFHQADRDRPLQGRELRTGSALCVHAQRELLEERRVSPR